MSLLKLLLQNRKVPFKNITIHIFKKKSRKNGYDYYGETGVLELRTWSVGVYLYLGDHYSDMMFLGTLCHELSHALSRDNLDHFHDMEWLQNSVLLMALAEFYLSELPVHDKGLLCATEHGPNIINESLDLMLDVETFSM